MPNYPTVHGELSALWEFTGNLQLLSRASSNSTSQLETDVSELKSDVSALENKTKCISHIDIPTSSSLFQCDLRVSGSDTPDIYLGEPKLYQKNGTERLIIAKNNSSVGLVIVSEGNGQSYEKLNLTADSDSTCSIFANSKNVSNVDQSATLTIGTSGINGANGTTRIKIDDTATYMYNNLVVSGSTYLGRNSSDTVTIKGVSADNTVTSILGINGSNVVKTRTVQSIVDEATNLGYVYYNINDTNYNVIYTLASTTKVLEINCTMTTARGLGLITSVWIEAEPYELGRRLIIVNSLNSTQKFSIGSSVAVNAYNPVNGSGDAGLEFYIGTSMELVLVKSSTPGQTKVWKTLNTAKILTNM